MYRTKRLLLVISVMVMFGVALDFVPSVMADQQTSIAGKQVIVARFTRTPIRIDGVLGPPGHPCCDENGENCIEAKNNEGFQLLTSVGGDRTTQPDHPNILWESRVGLNPRGYVVEFRIPLDSINTNDTSWWTGGHPGFRRPRPGDSTGFNVTVGDDDNGGDSYLLPVCPAHTNSYLAWDGSSQNWNFFSEQDWGILYLLP